MIVVIEAPAICEIIINASHIVSIVNTGNDFHPKSLVAVYL